MYVCMGILKLWTSKETALRLFLKYAPESDVTKT